MRLNQRTVYKNSIPLDSEEVFYRTDYRKKSNSKNETKYFAIQKTDAKKHYRYSKDVIFDTVELTEDIIDNSNEDQFNYMMREKSIENLNLVLQTLTAREERILRLYYIEDMSDTEIAKLFDRSRNSIFEIRKRSLRKLRHPTRTKLLKSFLER